MTPSPDTAPGWAGRGELAPGLLLYAGAGGQADAHAHHAIQLVLALDRPMSVVLDRERPLRRWGVLVPAGVPHAFDSHGGRIVLALADATGPRGAALARLARDLATRELSPRLEPPATPGDLAGWWHQQLQRLGLPTDPQAPRSPAVELAVDHVEAVLPGLPRLAEAAAAASISPSRLTRLFTHELGVPFRRFVLWSRIKHAADALQRGLDLTDAAAAAGFSDSAHLSRTFRSHFGMPPSALLRHVTIRGRWAAQDGRNVQAGAAPDSLTSRT